MLNYIGRRILESIPTLLGVTIITFLLVHLVPSSPARLMLGNHATPQALARLSAQMGLNKPLPVQYVLWLGQILHGNLGVSFFMNQPVATLIEQALPRTLAIVGSATVISFILSIVQGVFQAYRRNSAADHSVTVVAYFLYAMPTFWLGVLLIIIFSFHFQIFPSGGLTSPGQTSYTFTAWAAHLVLPVFTVVIGSVAFAGRFMRSSVVEVLVQDYIRTARSKGLGEWIVVMKHAFRNSLLPLITLFGFSIPGIFGGALFVEEIYNIPGMGYLFWQAALREDYPIILGVTLIIGVLTVAGNLIADLLYAAVDPRIQYN